MNVEEQIAFLGRWAWEENEENGAALVAIRRVLNVVNVLEKAGIPLEAEKIIKAYKAYGSAVAKSPRYQEFIDLYYEFCKSHIGVEPKLGPQQGNAMKQIIAYLVKQSKAKDDQGAVDAWQYILSNWKKLTPFIGNQTKLTQINRNIQEIITQLRNGPTKQAATENRRAQTARRIIERRKRK